MYTYIYKSVDEAFPALFISAVFHVLKHELEINFPPVFQNAEQRFPRYFDIYLKFFALFCYFYLFIPHFLTELLMTFRGIIVGKYSPKN